MVSLDLTRDEADTVLAALLNWACFAAEDPDAAFADTARGGSDDKLRQHPPFRFDEVWNLSQRINDALGSDRQIFKAQATDNEER